MLYPCFFIYGKEHNLMRQTCIAKKRMIFFMVISKNCRFLICLFDRLIILSNLKYGTKPFIRSFSREKIIKYHRFLRQKIMLYAEFGQKHTEASKNSRIIVCHKIYRTKRNEIVLPFHLINLVSKNNCNIFQE